MSKKVLLATEKAFSNQARDQVVGILKEAGYGRGARVVQGQGAAHEGGRRR